MDLLQVVLVDHHLEEVRGELLQVGQGGHRLVDQEVLRQEGGHVYLVEQGVLLQEVHLQPLHDLDHRLALLQEYLQVEVLVDHREDQWGHQDEGLHQEGHLVVLLAALLLGPLLREVVQQVQQHHLLVPHQPHKVRPCRPSRLREHLHHRNSVAYWSNAYAVWS